MDFNTLINNGILNRCNFVEVIQIILLMEYVRDNASEFINSDDGGQIKRRAEEIMKTGIKMKDAYHIACAERAGCDYLLTTDDRFLKYKTEDIHIINPIDFVLLLEGN